MGSYRDIVILADDVDKLVSRMRDDIDLWIADEKVCHDTAQCELHGGRSRCAAHGAGRFIQSLSYSALSQFGLTEHHHRVAVELSPSIGHGDPT